MVSVGREMIVVMKLVAVKVDGGFQTGVFRVLPFSFHSRCSRRVSDRYETKYVESGKVVILCSDKMKRSAYTCTYKNKKAPAWEGLIFYFRLYIFMVLWIHLEVRLCDAFLGLDSRPFYAFLNLHSSLFLATFWL